MNKKLTKVLIGVSIGVASYIIFRQLAKQYFAKNPPKVKQGDKMFAGFSKESSEYIAMQYDANHTNEDGTQGATWVGYNESPIVGFWQKGRLQQGAKVHV